jgi:hypothetical protein
VNNQEIDGPWEISGPERDDSDKTVFICNRNAPDYEVIHIKSGTVAERKRIASKIANLLNKGQCCYEQESHLVPVSVRHVRRRSKHCPNRPLGGFSEQPFGDWKQALPGTFEVLPRPQ